MTNVVVGVDGSPGSRAAVEFAAREAKLLSARLTLVAAWHWLTLTHVGFPGLPLDQTELRRAANEVLENTAAEFKDRLAGLDVELAVEEGHAAEVLVAKAKDAELLVVGSRGRGGFTGLLLGSVSQQCAQHASCPVVIVPSPPQSG
jgi:nucleotide-binding universal stress UspA family protein